MAEIRYPKITDATTEGQLRQMKEYLYQLTNQLNFALKTTEEKEATYTVAESGSGSSVSKEKAAVEKQKTPTDIFLSIKDLIVKSADIVTAYSEVIEEKLSGKYVAQSDFGEYKSEVNSTYLKTPEYSTDFYDSVQTIVSDELKGYQVQELRSSFYIKTGWLNEKNKIGGIEIGSCAVLDEDGNVLDEEKGFARFTPDQMAFYDGGGFEDENRVAWFAKNSSYFRNVTMYGDTKIEGGNVLLDGYMLDTSNGLAIKWKGR